MTVTLPDLTLHGEPVEECQLLLHHIVDGLPTESSALAIKTKSTDVTLTADDNIDLLVGNEPIKVGSLISKLEDLAKLN